MYDIQGAIPDALQVVLGWDLPDEALADAVAAQAVMLSGVNPEEIQPFCSDSLPPQSIFR